METTLVEAVAITVISIRGCRNMIWQERAIRQVRRVLSAETNVFVEQIRVAARLKGSESTFRRIAQANDANQMSDYFAEIRFGLMFEQLHFETEVEPSGVKGPDLSVSRDGQSAYVEVKRFRSGGTAIEEICDELTPYGNPPKDIKKVFDQIIEKFSQLNCGNGIVALWSERDDLEELEFEFAMKDIRSDAVNGIQEVPGALLFCVFGSGWFNPRCGQRIYIESFQQLSEPFSTWAEDLKRL
jgi:hypothetical protein